jgi:hypothetical protein
MEMRDFLYDRRLAFNVFVSWLVTGRAEDKRFVEVGGEGTFLADSDCFNCTNGERTYIPGNVLFDADCVDGSWSCGRHWQ